MLYPTANITPQELNSILEKIFKTYGYDFRDYSRASMQRRVHKFMDEMKLETSKQLSHYLDSGPKMFAQFLQRITVNITEMFRDPQFYAALREKVFPILASYPLINIWHAGCSTGEEVFSLAIMLHEAGLLQRCRIYATDINPENLEKAKTGIIPLDAMKEYTANYINAGGQSEFANYYTARYNNAIIRKDLREKIIFLQHNLVADRVFNEFQLIFCRNVMIYFNRQLQEEVLGLFHASLSSLGFLALGVKESMGFMKIERSFEIVNKPQKIYRRIT